MKQMIGLLTLAITTSACGFRAEVSGDRRRRHHLHTTVGGLIDTTERRCEQLTKTCIEVNLEDDGQNADDLEDGALCNTDSDCTDKFGV